MTQKIIPIATEFFVPAEGNGVPAAIRRADGPDTFVVLQDDSVAQLSMGQLLALADAARLLMGDPVLAESQAMTAAYVQGLRHGQRDASA